MLNIDEPKQPEQGDWKFVDELSKPIKFCFNWSRQFAQNDEIDLRQGVTLQKKFPEKDKCLETAYRDLNNFFMAAGIGLDGKYEIIIEQAATVCFEAYRIDIKRKSCHIQADDAEGIRRAIYYLEDLLLGADGAFLPIGSIERKPWLKTRISRCFFGPIKRPPLNRDELFDNVDYYPDEYLNRLAHEGINALWLTIAFSDICKTSITEFDPNAEKRLSKLRRTVEKCLRYGIKTYIFCVEPRSMSTDHPVFLNHPELKGAVAYNETYCFCPFSNTAQKYLYEATNWIFEQVPKLGGMINISFGERRTTCASADFGLTCQVCSKKTAGEIIAASLEPMYKGMCNANPNAELISWLYVPENYTGGCDITQLLDIARKIPENIVVQYNFESGGSKEQLGKKRHAGDYWLSYEGPSNRYKQIMHVAKQNGLQISAKIQVSCSHEIATVPLIPVPGLLYRKYKAMHKLGVSHVMQCWFFGNYPGIMNKAAGELAFEEFNDSEEDFLLRLARPAWGRHAKKTVRAWNCFTAGYTNYPLENMFQYYGPMHDGVVWPLYLIPVDEQLSPTWKLEYGTSADRYGECLGKFSLQEVLSLCSELSSKWHKGVEILQKMRIYFKDAKECCKDIALAEALDVHFNSGYNILKFYGLRDDLSTAKGKYGYKILYQMRKLVLMEIENSKHMLELCRNDSRLGFHPEAEGYKYFPEKLDWRIKLLKNLIKSDFSQVQKRLHAGKFAFAKRNSKSYICNSGKYEYTKDFSWKADYIDGKLKVSIDNFKTMANDKFKIYLETKPFHAPQSFMCSGKDIFEIDLVTNADEVGFNIIKINELNSNNNYSAWKTFSPKTIRLVLGDYNPEAKGRLILNENTK